MIVGCNVVVTEFVMLIVIVVYIIFFVVIIELQNNADLHVSEKATEFSEICFANPPSMNPAYAECAKVCFKNGKNYIPCLSLFLY